MAARVIWKLVALGGSEVFVFKLEQDDLVLVHKMKSWPR